MVELMVDSGWARYHDDDGEQDIGHQLPSIRKISSYSTPPAMVWLFETPEGSHWAVRLFLQHVVLQ